MNGGARGVTCAGLLVLALVAGAQIPLTTNERDQELSPRSLAYRAKILAALDGIKICPNAKLYEDPSGKGKISISARVRSRMVVTERPAQPTESEVIARSELILTRLGRRKGVDFEFVRASSLPDTEEWDPYLGISPTVGGQLVEFRRPAYRGFFDRDQKYIFEYNLVDDTLVRLEVPHELGSPVRTQFAKAMTVEEAATVAAKAMNRFQRETRAFWLWVDLTPAMMLEQQEAVWVPYGIMDEPYYPFDRGPERFFERISSSDRDVLIPAYTFIAAEVRITVRADTGEVRIPSYAAEGGGLIQSQMREIGRRAPQLSEFLVLSSVAFWILAPITFFRARDRARARKALTQNQVAGGHHDA